MILKHPWYLRITPILRVLRPPKTRYNFCWTPCTCISNVQPLDSPRWYDVYTTQIQTLRSYEGADNIPSSCFQHFGYLAMSFTFKARETYGKGREEGDHVWKDDLATTQDWRGKLTLTTGIVNRSPVQDQTSPEPGLWMICAWPSYLCIVCFIYMGHSTVFVHHQNFWYFFFD